MVYLLQKVRIRNEFHTLIFQLLSLLAFIEILFLLHLLRANPFNSIIHIDFTFYFVIHIIIAKPFIKFRDIKLLRLNIWRLIHVDIFNRVLRVDFTGNDMNNFIRIWGILLSIKHNRLVPLLHAADHIHILLLVWELLNKFLFYLNFICNPLFLFDIFHLLEILVKIVLHVIHHIIVIHFFFTFLFFITHI